MQRWGVQKPVAGQGALWRLMGGCVGSSILALISSGVQAAPVDRDTAMRNLAQRSGCLQCHAITAASVSMLDDQLPIGPIWQDVAAQYAGRRGIERRLVRIVRQGSDPQRVHWRGQVAGRVMPPNAVKLSEAEAQRLVRWILAL